MGTAVPIFPHSLDPPMETFTRAQDDFGETLVSAGAMNGRILSAGTVQASIIVVYYVARTERTEHRNYSPLWLKLRK